MTKPVNERRTSPLVLTSISLMVNSLLNHMLVCRVIRIQNLDCLPPSLAILCVRSLECERRHENSQCRALRVHTCLYEFLWSGEVGIAVNHCEGADHGCKPKAEYDWVSVVLCPFLCALECCGLSFQLRFLRVFSFQKLFLLRCVFNVVGSGGAICRNDGYS